MVRPAGYGYDYPTSTRIRHNLSVFGYGIACFQASPGPTQSFGKACCRAREWVLGRGPGLERRGVPLCDAFALGHLRSAGRAA